MQQTTQTDGIFRYNFAGALKVNHFTLIMEFYHSECNRISIPCPNGII